MDNLPLDFKSYVFFRPDLTHTTLDFELSNILKSFTPKQILLNAVTTSKYLCFSVSTLAVWRCNNRHDLPYYREGNHIYYLLSDLNDFIERHASQPLSEVNLCQSLLDRKSAAKEVNSTSGTLAVWVTNKASDLIYIKIGRAVRYRPHDLQNFSLERLRTRKVC